MYKKSLTGQIVLSPEHFSLGAGEFLGVTANTNLALAAPALLGALEKILPELKGLAIFSEAAKIYVDIAESAIAAARGNE